jgi:hypothetical protein
MDLLSLWHYGTIWPEEVHEDFLVRQPFPISTIDAPPDSEAVEARQEAVVNVHRKKNGPGSGNSENVQLVVIR